MIPLVDLAQQYKVIEAEIDAAIKDVLTKSDFISGPAVEAFEAAIASYCGCKHAIGVASGTDALLLSMMALGIGQGDEVITTPFTFVATASTISRVGAKPVFVDIDPGTYNMDIGKVRTALKPQTKAVVPVHLFGQPMNMNELSEIAAEQKLFIIEDAAQAIGARWGGTRVGSLGNAAAISFYPTKNLGAYGDGGVVLTNNDTVADRVRLLRQQGARTKYYHECVGLNSRLDEIQAAILMVKLQHLDEWNQQRRAIAYRYNSLFTDTSIVTPKEEMLAYHVYHQYTIQVPESRDELRAHLHRLEIATGVYYPIGLHKQPIYTSLGYTEGELPVCDRICQTVLCLPCYPGLSPQQQETITHAILKFYA